ncbi:MAG: hypothetical protein HQ521_11865 [Bacteroidetes bacterium]|nr:hypothetical protein [Bacteroidota bacterium]
MKKGIFVWLVVGFLFTLTLVGSGAAYGGNDKDRDNDDNGSSNNQTNERTDKNTNGNGNGGRPGTAPEPISCALFAIGGATLYGVKKLKNRLKKGDSAE